MGTGARKTLEHALGTMPRQDPRTHGPSHPEPVGLDRGPASTQGAWARPGTTEQSLSLREAWTKSLEAWMDRVKAVLGGDHGWRTIYSHRNLREASRSVEEHHIYTNQTQNLSLDEVRRWPPLPLPPSASLDFTASLSIGRLTGAPCPFHNHLRMDLGSKRPPVWSADIPRDTNLACRAKKISCVECQHP
ncbi:hypothetical protein Scep_009681 [Stephania cephalantha]|uniref:Uncharacterized protein n=1 Tax=Stephania cephalantha TaxID=152367 RepID=A0AAP0JUN4_9MAGN